MKRSHRPLLSLALLAAAGVGVARLATAQPRLRPPVDPAGSATQTAPPASGSPGPASSGPHRPNIGPDGKARGDTNDLKQFEQGVEYAPRSPNYLVAFSLEDADLPQIVQVIGELTGKRFIFGGKLRSIKATVYSPQKVTVAEAYQAFLSILETNGMTVIPHGRFLKIVETGGQTPIAMQATPIYPAGTPATQEERFVTRIHRLSHVTADEVSSVLGHFKSKEGDITVYGPGNLLIITDTGTNIRRMMQIVEDIDVGGVGDQIWIEPIHYGAASDIANRLNEVFDLKGGSGSAPAGKPGTTPAAGGAGAGDLHIAKILPDDRSNSLIIVATERAYLRILEFIKRIDLPHSGEGEIHVLALQHADATELAKTLTEIITGASQAGSQQGGGPRPGGGGATTPLTGIFEAGIKVSADKATNSIVVTSSLRDYAALRLVIDKLDQPRRQVFIEAVIMDLTIQRQNQLGVAFHAGDIEDTPVGGNSQSSQTLLFGGLNPFRSISLPSPGDQTLQAFALGIRGPGLPGSENLLGTGISIPAFGTLINALASTNDADILSTPHILALDNEKAVIDVGQNIAITQNAPVFGGLPGLGGATGANPLGALGGLGLGGLGASSARADLTTKITVTPHLNDSNEVRLDIEESIKDVNGEPTGTLGNVPFATRTATTKLVVRDQQTVVIGGLVRNRVSHQATKIPLLGDIPVLGALFRSTSDSVQKSNLLLILTPHIIRDQDDLRTIFERKMQERQEFLDHYFVFSDQAEYQPPKDYSRMHGLLEEIRQAYVQVDERKRLDELTKPREVRTHEPGQPIEMPATSRSHAAGADGAPQHQPTPGAPPPPPNINPMPQTRQLERIER